MSNQVDKMPGWEFYAGAGTAIGKELYYSKTYGTWMGRNFKLYKQTWGGNRFTGGKNKFGKETAKKEDGGAAQKYLSLLGDRRLDAAHGRAHRADLIADVEVDRGRADGLGQAVALEDDQPQPAVEVAEALAQGPAT